MSVSRRVVLSVGLLMLLALGVVGYQLWTVIRLQQINNELSKVSFVAAAACFKWNRMLRNWMTYSARGISVCETQPKKASNSLCDDRLESFDHGFRELDRVCNPGKRRTRLRRFPPPGFNTRRRWKAPARCSRRRPRRLSAFAGWTQADTWLKTPNRLRGTPCWQAWQRGQHETSRSGDQAVSVSLIAAADLSRAERSIAFFTVRAINTSAAGADSWNAEHRQRRILASSSRLTGPANSPNLRATSTR